MLAMSGGFRSLPSRRNHSARKAGAIVALTLGAMSLAGCTEYYTPRLLPPGSAANITVSDGPNYVTTQLISIDDKEVNLEQSTTQTLAPGAHKIRASIDHGSPDRRGWLTTSAGPRYGSGLSFTVKAEPGKTYVVRVREPVSVSPSCELTYAWVESLDGTFVGADMPVMLTRVAVYLNLLDYYVALAKGNVPHCPPV
jgi:hypothetical protein